MNKVIEILESKSRNKTEETIFETYKRELCTQCKNRNNKDNLSYYCNDCTKKQKNLYFYEQGNEHYEQVIVDKLKQYPDIQIDGIDYDKVLNTRVTMYDFPGVLNNLLYDLPFFLRKYNFTFEEYKFFIQQCKDNKFWIESKDLNTQTD